MSLLLVGISHRSAPLSMLDQLAAANNDSATLRNDVASSPFVAEAMVISTCNRIEVIADVARFHGAVNDIAERLAKHSGIAFDELTNHLYVHFEERAVHHAFTVASGLDSMIVGEQQILGQFRTALREAQDAGTAARALNALGQSALRVGKRVHTDTGIDRHGASVVSVALDEAQQVLGTLAGKNALVIGSGAMGALALNTLVERKLENVVVAGRSADSTQRVANSVGARAIGMDALVDELSNADVVVSVTGATGVLIGADVVADVMAVRSQRPIVLIDLALPHDIAPEVADVLGATRIDLSMLTDVPGARASTDDLAHAAEIVDEEVRAFLAEQAAQRVEPIVVSLRAKADVVLEEELNRLRLRHPELSDDTIAAVENALRRTVSNLLHTPTVRMKQFAADPDGQRYAEALHALFDLDPEAVTSLSAPGASGTEQSFDSVFDVRPPASSSDEAGGASK